MRQREYNEMYDAMKLTDHRKEEIWINIEENRKNIKDLNHNSSKIWKKIAKKSAAIAACFLLLVSGICGVQAYASGESFIQVFFDTFGRVAYASGQDKTASDQLQDGAAFVQGQSIEYDGCQYNLIGYYASKEAGIAVAEFVITDDNGNVLSEDSYKKIKRKFTETSELQIETDAYFDGSIDAAITRDQERNCLLIVNYMLQIARKSDRNVDTIKHLYLRKCEIEKEVETLGTFEVPKTNQSVDVLSAKMNDNGSIRKVIVTPFGIHMVFDDSYVQDNFKQKLIREGLMKEGEEIPEKYGYDYYETVELLDENKNVIPYEVMEGGEMGTGLDEDGTVEESIFFGKTLDVTKIDAVRIDGVSYKVK